MGNSNAMFAGVAGDLSRASALLYVAPVGTPIPGADGTSDPFVDLDPALWKDVGYVTQEGFSLSQDTDKNDIFSYGVQVATRTIKTNKKQEGSITFQETNPTVLEVYNSLPLGSVTVSATGVMSIKNGAVRNQKYAAIISATDGENRARWGMPIIEVNPSGEMKLSMGEILERAVSMNAYPDSTTTAVYENYKIPSLAAGAPAA